MARASRPASWWRHPRPGLLGALAVFLLAFIVYAPGLGPNRAPITFDTVAFIYPLRHYLALAWQHGRVLPLWTPDVFMGVPFLANIQNAVLYPPSLIYAVLPTDRALAIAMVVHDGIGGAGMYLYAQRALRLRPMAAVVAAVIFMLGPHMTAHLTHLNQNNTLAWAPWLMLATDRLAVKPGLRRMAVTGVLVALAFLAGHTQQFYFSLLLALLALVSRLLRSPGLDLRGAAIRTGALLVSMLVGLAVSGAQLVPTLELTSRSIRSGGLDLASQATLSLPLNNALGSMLPKYSIELPTEFAGASIGAVALFLMSIALVTRWRRPAVAMWVIVFLIGYWASTGPRGRLYDILFYGLPGLALFRVPARLLLFSTVAGALLSAYGVHTACQLATAARRGPQWRRRALGAAMPALALGLLLPAVAAADYVLRTPLPRVLLWLPHQIGGQDILAIAGLEIGAGLLLLLALARPIRLAPHALSVSLAALTTLDIFFATAHIDARHPLPMSLIGFRPAAARMLPVGPNQRYLSLYRPHADFAGEAQLMHGVAPQDLAKFTEAAQVVEVLRPDSGMSDGSLTPDGYDGGILPTRAYAEFRKPVLGASAIAPPDFTIHDLIDRVSDPTWLQEAGVSTVLTDAGTYPAASNCQCFTLVGTVDSVSVWTVNAGASRAWLDGPQGRRAANIVSDTGERVEIDLPDRNGGTLVLADSWYPGWTATVDGHPARIQLEKNFLRAVAVPPGASRVVFSYRPASLMIGLVISGLGIAVLLAMLLIPMWRRR